MNQLWVSAPTDRIQRGGGSVVVSSAGAITAISAAGANITLQPASGQRVEILGGGKLLVGDTLTVTGTGPHAISGPVQVSGAGATISGAFRANITDAGTTINLLRAMRSGAVRFTQNINGSDDTVLYVATGAAGSEVYTEALRIVNANAYTRIPTRLMVGAASDPSYPLHVTGTGYVTSYTGLGTAPLDSNGTLGVLALLAGGRAATFIGATSASAPVLVVKGGATPGAGGNVVSFRNSSDQEFFLVSGTGYSVAQRWADGTVMSVIQNNASVTTPVFTVKLGATPGAGADAQQWQSSASAVLARVTSAGLFGWIAGNTQTTVGAAGAASALPGAPAGYTKVDIAGTTYVQPYWAAA